MYARIVTCTLPPEKQGELNNILGDQVLPILKDQPGFVDLVGMASDDHPDHVLGMSLWKTKGDADRFYTHAAPMVDALAPLATSPPTVEHYNVQTSTFQYVAASKAA